MTEPRIELLRSLTALLDEALELAPGDRLAWLARLRAERPGLAAELESLLALEPELDARRFLADPVAHTASAS